MAEVPDMGGRRFPLWDIGSDVLDAIKGHMNNSHISEKMKEIEKAKETRDLAGVCNRCRLQDCLCNEGQV